MTFKLSELIMKMEELYPLDLSEEWDFPGLVFGDVQSNINKVLISVDITSEIIEQAIDNNCNLIVTHHPLFFRSVHLVGGDTFRGKMLNQLAKHNIAHYFIHTNADNQIGGTKTALDDLVNQIKKGQTVRDFATDLVELLNQKVPSTVITAKVAGDLSKIVNNPFAMPGSGDPFFAEAYQNNADVYITSDLRHHPTQDALSQYDYAIIDLPHFVSEYLWLYNLEKQLQNIGVTVVRSEKTTDPWKMVL